MIRSNEPLSELSVHHKTDGMCWEKVPRARCEMNFRPMDLEYTQQDGYAWAWTFLFLPFATSVLLYALVHIATPLSQRYLNFERLVAAAFVFGAFLGLRYLLRERYRPSRPTAFELRLIPTAFAVYFLTICIEFVQPPFGPAVIYLAVAGLIIPLLADRFCSHIVFWMSAHPQLDHATMTKWRDLWGQRFASPTEFHTASQGIDEKWVPLYKAALISVREHPERIAWLMGSLIGPAVMLVSVGHFAGYQYALYFLPLEVIVCLLALSVFTARDQETFVYFLSFIAHWLRYGKREGRAPWEFQSPAGSLPTRRASVVVVIVLLTVCLVPLCNFDPVTGFATGAPFFRVLVLSIGMLATAPCILLMSLYVVAGPLASALYPLLEVDGGKEHNTSLVALEGFSDRMRNSDNPLENNAIPLGINPHHNYPALLSTDLLFEHMHILGPTGSSKTAIGLMPLVNQLVARNDGAVVVIDGKGDNALFHTTRISSEAAGRKFKWFTNRPNRSTYIFNPFGQNYLERMTLKEISGLFMASLNLNHGSEYGRAFFSVGAQRTLQMALNRSRGKSPAGGRGKKKPRKPRPLQSFTDLFDIIHEVASSPDDARAAQHLAFIAQSLSEFEQLNMSPTRKNNASALKHAIEMSEVVSEKQVAYFYLAAAIDISSVAEIARLVVYSTLSATLDFRERTGKPPRVYLVIDEAQTVIAQNIANVLAQAREHGVACILAHQTLSQLNPPGGVDLRDIVLSCTAVKQIFSARDPMLKEYISKLSGEVRYAQASWKQLKRRVTDYPDETRRGRASGTRLDGYPITISEQIGPRLLPKDIEDHSRDPNTSILTVERHHEYSVFEGAFPIVTPWPMEFEEYRRRRTETAWPKDDEGTVEIKPDWPDSNSETIVALSHPEPQIRIDEPESSPAVTEDRAKEKIDLIYDKLMQ